MYLMENISMFRIIVCTLLCATMARSQLTACTEREHCPTGQFCESHFCRNCLSCSDINREPPRYQAQCVKSVIECGACVDGYTQGVSSECAALDGAGGVSPNVWLGLAIGFVIIVIVFAILLFLYLHRNTESLKIFTSTRASVHGQFSAPAPASAPQPPPPYHAAAGYDAPYAPPPHHTYVEEASPLVKRAVSGRFAAAGARESARLEAARVYHNPAYVRGAPLPDSPELSYEDESNRVEPFVSHDEDTMESSWTPATTDSAAHDDNGNAPPAAPPSPSPAPAGPLPPARRAAPADLAPPTKMLRLPQDTNNNRNSDSRRSGENPSAAAGGASVTLNFNLTAMQQLNNVSL